MTSAEDFWDWFKSNEIDYMLISVEEKELHRNLIVELNEQLKKYCNDIHSGICVTAEKRELIITADDKKELFDKVEELVLQAPEIDGWKFISLRPPTTENFEVVVNEFKIDAGQLGFLPLSAHENPALLGIGVFLKGYNNVEEKEIAQVAIVSALEQAAGEKLYALVVDFIEIKDETDIPEGETLIPIITLSHFLQWYKVETEKKASAN